MSEVFITELYKKLINSKLAKPTEVKGCSIDEINFLESKIGLKLQEIYKKFLLKFGRGAGEFFLGTDIFFDTIPDLREMAEELLEEDEGHYNLSSNAFVFSMHQGYQFMFFDLSNYKDDPTVFYYMEGMKRPKKKYDHFSDFLRESIHDYITMQGKKR